MTRTFLDGADVRATAHMSNVINAVAQCFRAFKADEFEMPPRTALGGGDFLVMPVRHIPSATLAVKSLSLNATRNPAIVGTVAWTDLTINRIVLADAIAVTALRTGAVVGVATDLLAPADANRLTVIGVGGQAADQIRAVHQVRPLTKLVMASRTLGRARQLLEHMRPELPGVELSAVDTIASALAGAQIVCCATSATEPLFDLEDLPERVHVNAIGAYTLSMRELPDALLAAATVVVDSREAALAESGEIHHAIRSGAIAEDDVVELADALEDRPSLAPRTVFKSVGLGIQDWAVMRILAEKSGGDQVAHPTRADAS